jgi:hypothetical protein
MLGKFIAGDFIAITLQRPFFLSGQISNSMN